MHAVGILQIEKTRSVKKENLGNQPDYGVTCIVGRDEIALLQHPFGHLDPHAVAWGWHFPTPSGVAYSFVCLWGKVKKPQGASKIIEQTSIFFLPFAL